jgi:hypothetical protein
MGLSWRGGGGVRARRPGAACAARALRARPRPPAASWPHAGARSAGLRGARRSHGCPRSGFRPAAGGGPGARRAPPLAPNPRRPSMPPVCAPARPMMAGVGAQHPLHLPPAALMESARQSCRIMGASTAGIIALGGGWRGVGECMWGGSRRGVHGASVSHTDARALSGPAIDAAARCTRLMCAPAPARLSVRPTAASSAAGPPASRRAAPRPPLPGGQSPAAINRAVHLAGALPHTHALTRHDLALAHAESSPTLGCGT